MATLTITIDLGVAAPGAAAGDFIDVANRAVTTLRSQYPAGGHNDPGSNYYSATKNSVHSDREQTGMPHVTKALAANYGINLTSVAVT